MIVYHGTGDYCLAPIQAKGLQLQRRNYTKRRCASTTTDIKVAQLFAARRTLATDFMDGKITGVVIEYEIWGIEKEHYQSVRDLATHQQESEIAIYNPGVLKMLAVHRRNADGDWVREPV